MTPGWFTIPSLVGICIGVVFFVVAWNNLPRAALWYAVLGAVPPVVKVGAFSGSQMTEGLALAEVLATVLIGVWLVRRGSRGRATVVDRWLIALVLGAGASLVSGYLFLDQSVPQDHVKLLVSIGQLLLLAWPIGTYFVLSDVVVSPQWIAQFESLMLWLAVPQFVIFAVPASAGLLGWSWYIGLAATPLAYVRALDTRSPLLRVALLALTAAPLIQGLMIGKAFLYIYVIVAVSVITWLRARSGVAVAILGVVAVWALLVTVVPDAAISSIFGRLVAVEEQQQSLSGPGSRFVLWRDAISIWLRSPLLGVGPGNSYPYMLRYSSIGTPHNQYLGILLEFGLVGLGCFLAFLWSGLSVGLKMVRRVRDASLNRFAVAWLGGFAGMAVGGVTGDLMLHSIRNGGLEMFSGYYVHWVMLGVAMSIAKGHIASTVQATRRPVTQPLTMAPVLSRPTVWVPPAAGRP